MITISTFLRLQSITEWKWWTFNCDYSSLWCVSASPGWTDGRIWSNENIQKCSAVRDLKSFMSCALCTHRLIAVFLLRWTKLLTLAFGQTWNARGLIKFHIISCCSRDDGPFPRCAWKTTNRRIRDEVYTGFWRFISETQIVWYECQTICMTQVSDKTYVIGKSYRKMFWTIYIRSVRPLRYDRQMMKENFIRFTQNKFQMIHINDYQKTFLSWMSHSPLTSVTHNSWIMGQSCKKSVKQIMFQKR